MDFAEECEGRRYQLKRPQKTVVGRAVGETRNLWKELEGKGDSEGKLNLLGLQFAQDWRGSWDPGF